MQKLRLLQRNLLLKCSDLLFILWAGGAALLSYTMVYALRKPYTAALFEGIQIFDMDYKVVVTITQIIGYVLSKFIGIKLISELKKEKRLTYILFFGCAAEGSLLLFGWLPTPYNLGAMFINGLSLGCMWGILFSFLEGRRLTDILASLLGVSILFSSGLAKSAGLYVMNTWHVPEFWMPALVGGIALPVLIFLAWTLQKLPEPNQEDITLKSKRETMNSQARWQLYKEYLPFLTILFIANVVLVVLRDIKEDFLVNIIDVSGHSSWLFAQIDTIITAIILTIFGLMVFIKDNLKALSILLILIILGMGCMTFISFNHSRLELSPITWLFIQSLCLYMGYLSFQTIFFDRFIACFRIKGNVGFFIAINDFLGYLGTVIVLVMKEMLSPDLNWRVFFDYLSASVGVICTISFIYCLYYLQQRYQRENTPVKKKTESIPEATPSSI
ncbi:MAG: DUF5690 family protein [Tannerellaceae bacterium]|nr:DUF5690 family protein [Tannerellaceae bacterium]